jgi:hypothetical protein
VGSVGPSDFSCLPTSEVLDAPRAGGRDERTRTADIAMYDPTATSAHRCRYVRADRGVTVQWCVSDSGFR